MHAMAASTRKRGRAELFRAMKRARICYLLLIPALIYYATFCYAPMYGVSLAFKEFSYANGIAGSEWIGLTNFQNILSDPDFRSAFFNTVIISFGRLLFEFPVPIILALMMNEVSGRRAKRLFQTVFTFPHFFSWIVVASILSTFLGEYGPVNQFLSGVGADKMAFLGNKSLFRPMVFLTSTWKEMGYSSIIYLSAIAGINPEMYEAAYIDGAGRFKQMLHVTLPSISNVITILFILAVGNAMNGGFDQIYNMYSPGVYEVGDIIDTFIYRRTFTLGASFGSSTAVGLLKSVINFALLLCANTIVSRAGGESLL